MYYIPAAEFDFKPLDDTVKAKQVTSEENFDYDASDYLDVSGDVFQYFSTAFENNPYDDTVSDVLGFYFTLDAPDAAIPNGSIVYQYVSYRNASDSTANTITVGCATKVGDAFASQIDTFNGTSSFDSDASAVAGRFWDTQNYEEAARVADSFKLIPETSWYKKFASPISGNSMQPCQAMLTFDGKLEEDDPIFTSYDVTIGARIYSGDSDTEPKSLPTQSYTIDFTAPVSDLSTIKEEN